MIRGLVTPVSRASADLTQYSCPDRDVNRSSGTDRHAINITIVMQLIFADIEPQHWTTYMCGRSSSRVPSHGEWLGNHAFVTSALLVT